MPIDLLVDEKADEVPERADDVGDENGDDVEPDHFIDVQHHVLEHNLFVAGRGVAQHVLYHLAKLGNAKQLQ